MPLGAVKMVEVITPVELEFVVMLVVGEHLDIVVKQVPWHVNRVKAFAPGVEGGCPEVHSQ